MNIDWSLVANIATALGFIALAFQIYYQRKEMRNNSLTLLYDELDNEEMREARRFIYRAFTSELEHSVLSGSSKISVQNRIKVEKVLSYLERVCYRIYSKQISEKDAYELYRDALLGIFKKLWNFIKEERIFRNEDKLQKPKYRRFFEYIFRIWAVRYMKEEKNKTINKKLSTEIILNQLKLHLSLNINDIPNKE